MMAILGFLPGTTSVATIQEQSQVEYAPPVVEEVIVQTDIASEPVTVALRDTVLWRICSCESAGDPESGPVHYGKDGDVLRGRIVWKDTGMCQINSYYWGEKAKELGLDIETEHGNIEMANYIYDTYGTQPWAASRSCWGG